MEGRAGCNMPTLGQDREFVLLCETPNPQTFAITSPVYCPDSKDYGVACYSRPEIVGGCAGYQLFPVVVKFA